MFAANSFGMIHTARLGTMKQDPRAAIEDGLESHRRNSWVETERGAPRRSTDLRPYCSLRRDQIQLVAAGLAG